QISFEALLEPQDPGTFSYAERYAVAAFVAGVAQSGRAATFYLALLADEAEDDLVAALQQAIAPGTTVGPVQGCEITVFAPQSSLWQLWAAGLDFAHLLTFHPKDASPASIAHLDAACLPADDFVSLSQLIAFLDFQQRVAHGIHL